MMLYTFNLCNDICQSYLNRTWEKRKPGIWRLEGEAVQNPWAREEQKKLLGTSRSKCAQSLVCKWQWHDLRWKSRQSQVLYCVRVTVKDSDVILCELNSIVKA